MSQTIIAGRGKIRRKGRNGWGTAYEGKPAKTAELSRPHFAMADKAGNIYIADKDAHAIRRVDPKGIITTVAGTNRSGNGSDRPGAGTQRALSFPNGIWVRSDGTVYILDLGNGKIRRLDPAGRLTTMFRIRGGISIGRGLWVSRDEKLAYVASETKILRWRRGRGVSVFARGFRSLGNLVATANGDVLVTDRSAGRVYRITAKGKRSHIAGNGRRVGGGSCSAAKQTSLRGVRAVWPDKRGGMFLGTHESSQVWYVDRRGIIHRVLGAPTISEVRGIGGDHKGNIIIVENDHGFVRLLRVRPKRAKP